MDPRIRNLPSTTFAGERLSRPAIAEIQETVQFFPALSRSELVRTVCEQLGWHTPEGTPRLGFGLRVLGALERRGIVRLPAKRGPGRGPQKPLQFDARTAPQPAVREPLAELAPVRLELATEPEPKALWNQWVDRYHPLGYRQPLGVHLRYWVRDGRGRLLGCLLFDRATRRLPCRDRFIGWEGPGFRERLHLVVRNARYLLFDWVTVDHLASHVPGLAARQLPGDWERWHGWRPVLLETFVNPRRHDAACYRAANWQRAGPHAGPRGPRPGPGQAAQGGLRPPAASALEAHPAGGPAAATAAPADGRRGFPRQVAGHPRQRGAGRRRARPALAAPPAIDPHAAGGAVRAPPGARAAPAGLRPGAGRPVGVLPAAGPGAAAGPPAMALTERV